MARHNVNRFDSSGLKKMKLLSLVTLMFLPFQVLSLEVFVFEKHFKIVEPCTLVTSHKKSLIQGSLLSCNVKGITSFELSIGGDCYYEQFVDAIDEPTEKIEVDLKKDGVRYIEFHLKDREKGTPLYSRVIKDKNSCLIVLGKSLSSISEKTESLWLENDM